jgi:hypothetical protein
MVDEYNCRDVKNGVKHTMILDNPNLISYEVKTDYRYLMRLINNIEGSEVTYNLNMTYPKFEGMTLLPPFSGQGYDISLKPKSVQVVMIKLDCKGYSYSSSYSESLVYSDEALVEKCLEQSEA